MKLKLILTFLLPLLLTASAQLRAKDENSTGWDDEAADAIDIVVEKLQKYGVI
jgi:hypothetical protein